MSDGNESSRQSRHDDLQSPASLTPSAVGSFQTAETSGPRNVSRPERLERPERPGAPRNYGSVQSSVSGRPQSATTRAQPQTPKKPTLGRRTTSTHSVRPKEFSVDDSQEEFDQDYRLAKTASASGNAFLRRRDSTIRRRPAAQTPSLPRLESEENEDDGSRPPATKPTPAPISTDRRQSSEESEETLRPEREDDAQEEVEEEEEDADETEDDEADLSDAESFTLKDRQEAINETHPFGIRIWKPALYKKDRSVQATAEGDIHSTPGGNVSRWLFVFNILWTLLFGWWLALLAAVGFVLCFISGGTGYGVVLWSLAGYLLYPFGKFVKLEHDEAYLHEDEGEGRSISEYERWQTGDLEEGRLFFGPTQTLQGSLIGQRRASTDSADENDSLLGRPRRNASSASKGQTKKRPFGRGKWSIGRVVFFVFFYGLLTPMLLLVSLICWFLVFTIPMGRVVSLLLYHLRRHPLALSFHSDSQYTRSPSGPSSSILLCTYRAVGTKYWKYTIDGTNIFLINLLGLVAFAIFDFFVLREALEIRNAMTSSGFIFMIAILSIIPLAYFIGQAVASISAQSTMGVGATINAFFSTVVEVFLYCVALNQGKGQLVEGSIIGSIFAGILLLPGVSMCFGAIRRKTQRFNVRSAGVTSTMLMFAIIGSFSPTLFYRIYGSHELYCADCTSDPTDAGGDCRRCYFSATPSLDDDFFVNAVRPYIWFSAVLLFLAYVIGLFFTLRTHAAIIWNNEPDEKKQEKTEVPATSGAERHSEAPGNTSIRHTLSRQNTAGSVRQALRDNVRESQLYKRILGQSLKSAGLTSQGREAQAEFSDNETTPATPVAPHFAPPPKAANDDRGHRVRIPGLSAEDNNNLVRQVAELAATAATVAARDTVRAPRKASEMASTRATRGSTASSIVDGGPVGRAATVTEETQEAVHPAAADAGAHASGGHDAPNWSRTKSAVILLSATVAYAVIAEILVDTVDSVLEHVDIDEKFLGITLFALVPNTTEFLNAISFAMNGNIALSMEIGSAYALQVMLLQVPALVLFSGVYGQFIDPAQIANHTFNLVFPQWDMVTVILGLFLMNYVIGEGKSNYFKGSMLVLSYLVIVVGFWFSGYNNVDTMGVDRFDTLAIKSRIQSFKTIGQSSSGRAFWDGPRH